ncbi:MAG: 3'(2'),5'-bisphosphate nucleotidase CysQ [bacterium]
MQPQFATELTHAKQIVRGTWEKIRLLYLSAYEIEDKRDGPSTQADKAADKYIVSELQKRYSASDYGYLSEESQDNRQRLQRERVWIIDPIDGTNDFIARTGYFGIQIGLVERRGDIWQPVLGVMYQPVADRLYFAVEGQGAFVEASGGSKGARTSPLRVSDCKDPRAMRLVVSRSHMTEKLQFVVARIPQATSLRVGGMGIKLCRIAQNEADYYVNISRGKTKEWDTCAPELILREAGGTITDLDGKPLRYNREEVRQHRGVVASNGPCHVELLKATANALALWDQTHPNK